MKRFVIIIIAMGMFSCFSRKQSPEVKFWAWFSGYSHNFPQGGDLTGDIADLFGPLSKQLDDYCKGLVFQIGYDKQSSEYELVVSADGDRKLFSQVEKLVDNAPNLEHWKITAFRQPTGDSAVIQYGTRSFDATKILFLPLIGDNYKPGVNIEVVYPDYREEDRNLFLGGTFLLLDAILGEKSTELDLGYINVTKMPDDTDRSQYIPLSELRNYIASVK